MIRSAEAISRGFTDRRGRVTECCAEDCKASIRPVTICQGGKGLDNAGTCIFIVAGKELVDLQVKIGMDRRGKGELTSARPSNGHGLAGDHPAQHIGDVGVARTDRPVEENLHASRSQKPVILDIDAGIEQVEGGVGFDVKDRKDRSSSHGPNLDGPVGDECRHRRLEAD